MRNSLAFLLILAAVALLAGPAGVAAEDAPRGDDGEAADETVSITFGSQSLGVGYGLEQSSTMDFRTQFVAFIQGNPVGEFEQTVSNNERRQFEVLAVDENGRPTTYRLAMLASSERRTGPEGESRETCPTVGRVYRVVRTGESVEVTYDPSDTRAAEGDEVPEAELAVVREDADDSTSNRMRAAIAGKTFEKGQKLEVNSAELFGDHFEAGTFEAVFSATRVHEGRAAGVFTVAMTMSQEPAPGLRMNYELKGELVVDRELAAPLYMRVTGPVSIAGSNDGVDFTGGGTMTMQRTATVRVPTPRVEDGEVEDGE